ncbi:hypothetical protein ACXIUS_00390 [Bosea thiooxidans]
MPRSIYLGHVVSWLFVGIVQDAPDKLACFMELTRTVLLLVAQRPKVKIGAVGRWGAITATIGEEVARNSSMRFDRDESSGTVVA